MSLHTRSLSMLRAIAYQPRSIRYWTSGDFGIAQNAVESYLSLLHERGYIEVTGRNGARMYAITPKGERALADRPETASSRIHCNASTTESFRGTVWHIRPGGEQHKQFKSFGDGC